MLQTNVSASASVSFGNAGATSGMSATATATLEQDTVTAKAGDAGSASPSAIHGQHYLHLKPNGNLVTLSKTGSVTTDTANGLPWATWVDSAQSPGASGPGTYYYDGPPPNGQTSANAYANVSATAHITAPAHPINFRCISASADSEGNLHYEYAWDSSTGNLADLDACTIKERLSYDGNSTGYYSKDVNGTPCYVLPPPFKGVFANPEIYGGTSGTQGGEGDDQFVPQIPGPYQYGSYTAIQDYIYTDDNSNPNNPNDYTVLRGPIDIVRTVWAPDINWVYDITKYDYPDALSGSYLSNRLILAPVYPQFGP